MRIIVNSRSYDNPNATAAYTHCLLRANIKAGTVKGIFLQRGQFLTSVEQFAEECGMSEKQMRTALDMLVADGLIMRNSAPSRANNRANNSKRNGTIITVVNYGFDGSNENQQGEKSGEEVGEEQVEEVGNSIINIIRNNKYRGNKDDMDRPEPEGNTHSVSPSNSGSESESATVSDNHVTNPDALRIATAFIERGFSYDGNGRGGLEGYIAQQLSAGVPEEYLFEALNEYERGMSGKQIRKKMGYYTTVLNEVIESHNQGLR